MKTNETLDGPPFEKRSRSCVSHLLVSTVMAFFVWVQTAGAQCVADLLTGASDPNPVPAGAQAQVSAFLFNDSTNAASNVVVTITLSDPLVYLSASSFPPGASFVPDPGNSNLITGFFGDVFGSVSFSLLIEVTNGASPGIETITFEAISDCIDLVPGNNTYTAIVTVAMSPFSYYDPIVGALSGDPVGSRAGNYLEIESTDINLDGPGVPILFERYYDSALFSDGVIQSALGHNWQHNWDIRLSVAGTNATVAFRRGRILLFENDGINWNQVFNTQIGFQLVDLGSEFVLGDPRSQLMYFFNGGGLLTRIEDGRGNTNLLSYTGNLLSTVTDGLNRTLSFSYDANGLLTNVTDGVRSVSYGHTGTNLTSFTDANGKVTTYAYDPTNANNPGLMTARTLPEGNTPFTQVYNAAGRVVLQTDALGNTNSLAYSTQDGNKVTTMTDPLGNTMIHTYRPTGELSEHIDEAGESVLVIIDSAGRRNQVFDRKGQTTRITYDADSGLPTEIDHPFNNDDEFDYTGRMVNGINFLDLTRITRPDFTMDRFGYDALGNLIAYTNRTGHVWTFENNARGQLLSATNPTAGVASFTYDANARLASATDSEVGVTTFEYDSLNRLTNITHPNPDTVQFAWDVLNRLTSVTDERTNTTTFAYDDNSRLTGITNALNQETHFTYDGLNRLVRAVDRLGKAATFSYDPRSTPSSLLAAVTNRNGFVSRFEYDNRRRLTGVVDPAGKTNSFGYDSEGLLLAATNPLGETVGLERDRMGYVTNLIDPLGNELTLVRDQMKRVTRVTDPLGRIANYTYDPRGLLASASRGPDIEADYDYDALGNLTRIIDPNNRFWRFTYTPMGRMSSSSDPISRTNFYTYDVRGRLETVTYPDGATQTNSYDGANNLTRVQFSDATDFQYAYDALHRLTNASSGGTSSTSPVSFTYDAMDRVINTHQVGLDFGAAYDADGRLTNVTYNSGQFTVIYTYDSRDRLTGVSDTLTGTSLTFTYDDAHRLTSVTRPNGVNGSYTYDPRGLITRIQEGSVLDLQYAYDNAGQVVEADYVTVPIDPTVAAATGSVGFFYDSASQISSTPGYAYNPRGNQSQIASTNVSWDDALRVRAVGGASYTYNALSDLETRIESGNTNRYFYNYAVGLNPIMAERNDNTAQFVRFYVWSPGGTLLHLINLPGNTVSFPLFDRVGSTLALTDGAGAVSDAYAYNAYGRVLSQSGTNQQPFRFNGEFGIRADGPLYHMRARWYDPVTTRFISKDPIWPVLTNPKELNPYGYVRQHPLGMIDPTGELAVADYGVLLTDAAIVTLSIEQLFGPSIGNISSDSVTSASPKMAVKFKRWTGRSPWPKPREPNGGSSTAGVVPVEDSLLTERFAKEEFFGSFITYTLNDWAPTEDVRFHESSPADRRPPNIAELFNPAGEFEPTPSTSPTGSPGSLGGPRSSTARTFILDGLVGLWSAPPSGPASAPGSQRIEAHGTIFDYRAVFGRPIELFSQPNYGDIYSSRYGGVSPSPNLGFSTSDVEAFHIGP